MFLKIKYIPPVVAAILVFVGIVFFNDNIGIMGNLILLGAIIGTLPFILISYFEFQWIRSIEEQIPAFLLDLSETQKTGMSLPEALRTVSKTDYGKLTGEIKKINDQMSWGIPVQEALARFAHRTKKSDMISRIVRIIVEAYSSGGDIVRTMEATANDIQTIKEAEKEKKGMAFEHVMVMYAIYYIFIGIVIGLSKTLIPMLSLNVETTAIGGIMSFQDPCTTCIASSNIYCISCLVFGTVCKMFALGKGAVCYYYALFLMMSVVQGICSGLVAGQIGENSVIAGIKHSAIMTISGFSILMIALQVGLI
jgi:flagellar protein FlaJ